jgi:hypothetical protein
VVGDNAGTGHRQRRHGTDIDIALHDRFEHVGLDAAGVDAVRSDVVAEPGEFDRHAFRQHADRGLAGAIGGIERRAAHGADRGEIDDRGAAGTSLAAGLEQRQAGLDADDDAVDVDAVQPVPFGQRRVLDFRDDRDGSVVDQRIETAMLCRDDGDDAVPVGGVRHVMLQVKRCIDAAGFGGEIGGDYRGAGGGHRLADLSADAAGSPGDKGDDARECDRHVFKSLLCGPAAIDDQL